jgi:hypothetical protein
MSLRSHGRNENNKQQLWNAPGRHRLRKTGLRKTRLRKTGLRKLSHFHENSHSTNGSRRQTFYFVWLVATIAFGFTSAVAVSHSMVKTSVKATGTNVKSVTPKSVAAVCKSTVRFSSNTFTIAEGSNAASASLRLSAPCAVAVHVNVVVTPKITGPGAWTYRDENSSTIAKDVHGTGEDIRVVQICVEIPAGQTTAALPLQAIEDPYAELDETFTLTLSEFDTNVASPATAVGTILDNDRSGIFNAASYGAIPNDQASDSASIQKAINAAAAGTGRGVVVLNPGLYVEAVESGSQAVKVPPGITIEGYGATIRRSNFACGANPTKCYSSDFSASSWNSATDSSWLVVRGLTFDGNSSNQGPYKSFEQEQVHQLYLSAAVDNGTAKTFNTGRLRVVTEDLVTKDSVGDGILVVTNTEHKSWNTRGEGNFRGHLVITGGNVTTDWWDFTTTHGTFHENTGIDIEVDAFGKTAAAGDVVSVDIAMHNGVIDADLDVALFLPSWMGACYASGTGCGPASSIVMDNIQMQPSGPDYYTTGGAASLFTMRTNDQIVVKNSTLRFGEHFRFNENQIWVWNGSIEIQDTKVFVGKYPYPGLAATEAGVDISGKNRAGTGAVTFERVTFQGEGAPFEASNKCGIRKQDGPQPIVNWKGVTVIGDGWCGEGGSGYVGSVNVSAAAEKVAVTTSTIPGQLPCGGVELPKVQTVAPPTTTAPPVLTVAGVPEKCNGGSRLEGEAGLLSGSWVPVTPGLGASGNSFVQHQGAGGTGSAIWSINAPIAGSYNVCFRTQTGGSGAARGLTVAGKTSTVEWPAQGTWTVTKFGPFDLPAGPTRIELGAPYPGGLVVDVVDLCPVNAKPSQIPTTKPKTGKKPTSKPPKKRR